MLLPTSQSRGTTVVELMISAALILIVTAAILTCLIGLQRGFAFSVNWSESRVAQRRVLDSMSMDLTNATRIVVGNGQTFLILTLPCRYDAYQSTGFAAGDPQISSANQLVTPVINSTTGNVVPAGGHITVVYSLANNTISRTVWQASSWLMASRTVGAFGNTVSVRFTNTSGTVLSGTLAAATDTIVPIVITTVASASRGLPSISGTMSDIVFLRGKCFQ